MEVTSIVLYYNLQFLSEFQFLAADNVQQCFVIAIYIDTVENELGKFKVCQLLLLLFFMYLWEAIPGFLSLDKILYWLDSFVKNNTLLETQTLQSIPFTAAHSYIVHICCQREQ